MPPTARQRQDAASPERAAELQTALTLAEVGVWSWHFATDRLSTIQGGGPLSSLSAAESPATGAALLELVHPEDRSVVRTAFERASLHGSYEAEFRIVLPDEEIRWVAARGRSVKDAAGTPVSLTSVDQDITSRKRAEEALRDREHRLETIIEHEPACVKVVDRDGRLIEMNRAGLAMLEVASLAEAQEQRLLDYLLPEHRAGFVELHRRVLGGESATLEFEVTGRGGTRRWLQTHAAPLANAAGDATALLGVTHDVSERRASLLRIGDLNRVHAVLSSVNQAIVREPEPQAMLDAACRIAVDQGGFAMAWIGFTEGAAKRLRLAAHAGADDETLAALAELLGTDDRDPDCAFTYHALETGTHGICNDTARDPLAETWRAAALERGFRAMASLPLTAGTRVIGTFNLYASTPGIFDDEELGLLDGLAADISFALELNAREAERRRIDTALRESEERFRQLAANVKEVLWMTDPVRAEILYVSPAFERIWGRSCASLYAAPQSWMDAVHPDDRSAVREAARTKQEAGTYDETYRIVRPDGAVRWVHDRAFPVKDEAGSVERLVGTVEDVTDRRQLEEQVRQSQKLEAIGQLAGGVAHDFNNILTVIQGYGSLLLAEDISDEAANAVEQVLLATNRAANLTRQLLTFGRRQVMQPGSVDLNDIVGGLAKMLQRILGEDVHLEVRLHPTPLFARADAGMLDQVLMNLVVNARDAMPDGGQLVIDTTTRRFGRDDSPSVHSLAPGPYVGFVVQDTGIGIRPADVSRLFEPFYTTKTRSEGMGLGLATVLGIVKQHAGVVNVESTPGSGTAFSVFLPAEPAGDAERSAKAPTREPRRGQETILLVEDEAVVRSLTRLVLERQGYRVLEAGDGVEALRVWGANQGRIRLLLTDIVLPAGVGGRQLAARLRALDPSLRVVFMSGYSAEIAGRELTLEEGRNFVQKPYSPPKLLEAVERCLDA